MRLSLIINSSLLKWNGVSRSIPSSNLVWFNIFISFGNEIESMYTRFLDIILWKILVPWGDKNEEKKYSGIFNTHSK